MIWRFVIISISLNPLLGINSLSRSEYDSTYSLMERYIGANKELMPTIVRLGKDIASQGEGNPLKELLFQPSTIALAAATAA